MNMNNKIINFLKKYILNKYVILIIFGVLWLLFFDSYSMMDRLEDGQKCIHLKEEIKHYKNEIKQSQRKMNELESNKDGLERFAREQYLMKREEEDIFIFEEE